MDITDQVESAARRWQHQRIRVSEGRRLTDVVRILRRSELNGNSLTVLTAAEVSTLLSSLVLDASEIKELQN